MLKRWCYKWKLAFFWQVNVFLGWKSLCVGILSRQDLKRTGKLRYLTPLQSLWVWRYELQQKLLYYGSKYSKKYKDLVVNYTLWFENILQSTHKKGEKNLPCYKIILTLLVEGFASRWCLLSWGEEWFCLHPLNHLKSVKKIECQIML